MTVAVTARKADIGFLEESLECDNLDQEAYERTIQELASLQYDHPLVTAYFETKNARKASLASIVDDQAGDQ
jgi:hypothetical protein